MSGSLYGMQGMGTTGMGAGQGVQIPPSPMASLMGGQGQAPGGMQGPMAQFIGANMQPQMQQHPQLAAGPQQPFVPGQQPQQPGAQQQQSPMAALLAQLKGGQQGVAPPQAQPGANPLQGAGGMLGNLMQGYNPQGYGMTTGAPSPQLQQMLQQQVGGGGVA